jgi:hypothetical protein
MIYKNTLKKNTKTSFIDTKVCMKVHDYVSNFFSDNSKKIKIDFYSLLKIYKL